MSQKGFATLEVILMVVVIGILASIAVPRFTSVTTSANTAKIQADLTTIDTAIAVYQMEKTDELTTVKQLADAGYLQSEPKPPTGGKCYINGSESSIPGEGSYGIDKTNWRAYLGTEANTADKFTKNAST